MVILQLRRCGYKGACCSRQQSDRNMIKPYIQTSSISPRPISHLTTKGKIQNWNTTTVSADFNTRCGARHSQHNVCITTAIADAEEALLDGARCACQRADVQFTSRKRPVLTRLLMSRFWGIPRLHSREIHPQLSKFSDMNTSQIFKTCLHPKI